MIIFFEIDGSVFLGCGTLKTFPKYEHIVKYNGTTTTESITFEDQRKWLILRCSVYYKSNLKRQVQLQ